MQCIFHTCITNDIVAQSVILSGRFCYHDSKDSYLDPVCFLIVRDKLLRRAVGTFLSQRRHEVSHFHGRASSYHRFHLIPRSKDGWYPHVHGTFAGSLLEKCELFLE